MGSCSFKSWLDTCTNSTLRDATRDFKFDCDVTGGEVTTVDASPGTTVGEFKRLVIEILHKDDDELTRKVTFVDLVLGEKPLLEESATLSEIGCSPDVPVLAIFKQRCVECIRWKDAKEDLTIEDRHVVLNIPEGTGDIPWHAFKGCKSIQTVQMPNSVTSIGSSAFCDCTSLTRLTMSDCVTSIGEEAFCYCSSLASLTIPDSVTSIERATFGDCSSLTCVTIPDSVTSIGSAAFHGCSALGILQIPNSVTSIRSHAFYGCSSLTSLTLPDSVISIGDNAFSGCSSLTCLTVPRSIKWIGRSAFHHCSSLMHLKLPQSVSLETFADRPEACVVEWL